MANIWICLDLKKSNFYSGQNNSNIYYLILNINTK